MSDFGRLCPEPVFGNKSSRQAFTEVSAWRKSVREAVRLGFGGAIILSSAPGKCTSTGRKSVRATHRIAPRQENEAQIGQVFDAIEGVRKNVDLNSRRVRFLIEERILSAVFEVAQHP